jgi:ligand-binding SRPBCC domain-containing protein
MYQLKRTQIVKTDLKSCWDFFSSPENLSKITPDSMGFNIRTMVPEEMYEGLIISYTVKPLLRIPINWVTEITHVKPMEYFVDEQRKGPYKMWHHEHHFREIEGGVEMIDIVSYELPFGFLGKLIHPIVVEKKLNEIFSYRTKVISEFFN